MTADEASLPVVFLSGTQLLEFKSAGGISASWNCFYGAWPLEASRYNNGNARYIDIEIDGSMALKPHL